MEEKKYWMWLSSIPGVGSKRFINLINYFKEPENVFNSSEEELIKCGLVPLNVVKQITINRDIKKINKYLNKVQEKNIKVYTIFDDDYPENLKNIYDPPPIIYVKGELIQKDNHSIAIVGSRKASDYGMKAAQKISSELAQIGVTIVSGMALGIDSHAHRGALNSGGRTIAVFACGLNHIYPPSGLELANDIIKNGGVISEYPIGAKALPVSFPARNRIISGISLGTIVIEAGEKSGSLITADFAAEQGREVFAVPGSIFSHNSKGTNSLIKNGAKLVESIDDILQEFSHLNLSWSTEKIHDKRYEVHEVSDILSFIDESGKTIDQIIEHSNRKANDILSEITILELKGFIYNINGCYFRY